MLQALQSVISLLLGAGILILGNGLVGIVLPVRMSLEHVPTEISGLVMSAYYAGLVLGCLWSRDLIVRVGHIRAFAAFAALVGATTLVFALWFDPLVWGLLRVVVGEVDDDAPLGEREGRRRTDQPGSDDERGSHWAMSLRRAPVAPR